MRFLETLTVACLLLTNTPVIAHPQPVSEISTSSASQRREAAREAEKLFAPVSDLWKRKGGGGGGGKGGGGSSSGSSGKGGSSGSSGSGSSGYVPTFIQGIGPGRSKGGERMKMVDGVGSSTSTLAPRKHHSADARFAVEHGAKSAAGEVKDALLRSRRFIPGIAAGRSSGFSSGKSGNNARMGPSSGHRAPLDGKNKGNDKDRANRLRSGSTGRGSAGSNAGGQTKTGSGVSPSFGGKYGGGAKTPYTAGRVSPLGIAPIFLGVGLLSIYPGLWLYGAYGYGYHNPYNFRNRTARRNETDNNTTNTPTRDLIELVIRQDDSTGVNESKPVTCLCAQYAVCGCDDDGNYTFLDSIIGDGDYFKLNYTLVTVADVNGTSTILLNGTLPNGTTASGGTEDAITSNSSDGSAAVRSVIEAGGYWIMIATVALTCFVL
ncbi:hypothetical protein BKA64DRAFT_99931 [Cadophora sp. MPI-SDFR-AT-0126]|nr:hypothetical protein BKA64DRAFT_99931 [Leotiomycetes sp. MPI-SDFR-AT-0126]